MHELDMRAARALVTKAELDELLAAPASSVPAGEETAEAPPVAGSGSGEEAGHRMFEQAFRYWEQTVRDLQREVKALRERVEQLERMREAFGPAKPTAPVLPIAGASGVLTASAPGFPAAGVPGPAAASAPGFPAAGVPGPAAASAPVPPAASEPETPRLSRVERYRKSRWF